MKPEQINRIKVVLVEQNKKAKWLAHELDKDPATISRWCNNHSQPSLEMLDRIAKILKVDRRKLLNESKYE